MPPGCCVSLQASSNALTAKDGGILLDMSRNDDIISTFHEHLFFNLKYKEFF